MNRRLIPALRRAFFARWLLVATLAVVPTALSWWLLEPASQALPATQISLQLSPPVIAADGTSTSTATATVTGNGNGAMPDNVTIMSSDPLDVVTAPMFTSIDSTTATYTATIRSADAGRSTITATDSTPTTPVVDTKTLTKFGSPSNVTLSLQPGSIQADGVSTSIATATVTDSQGDPVPNASIVFSTSDPGERISATNNNRDGTYSAIITSSTRAGLATITATDSVTHLAAHASLTQTAGPARNLAVQVVPSSIIPDGSSTATATASVADANGNPVTTASIVFASSDPGERVSTTTNEGNDNYSATITSSTRAGSATITATDQSTGVSGQAQLTQSNVASSTTLVPSPSSPVTNQSVTLFAAVSAIAVPPTGTVTFANSGIPIANCVAKPVSPQNPTAMCVTSFAASSSPLTLTATFTPSAGSLLSSSTGRNILTVGKDATSTSLGVSSGVLLVGGKVTYIATVAPSHAGPYTPSGSVEFLDGSSVVSSCSSQPLSRQNGVATAACTTTYPRAGTHMITAMYRGDTSFAGSTSPQQSFAIQRQPILGRLAATMQWSFYFSPSYTQVLTLRLQSAPIGSTVRVSCAGKGCPFNVKSTLITQLRCKAGQKRHKCPPVQAHREVSLQPGFGDRRLGVGALITVEIVRPNWVGKYYSFKIRSARGPKISIGCLAPGSSRPNVGC